MGDLVHQGPDEITVGGGLRRVLFAQQAPGERNDDLGDPRVHVVLEEDPLAPLLLVDARVVGEVVGDRLVAVPQVARAEGRVHHLHRSGLAALGGTVLGRERQRVLDVGHVLLEDGELPALLLVADEDGGAVGTLHAEQTVQVRLVGREDQVEFRVRQLDPGHVARVVVVGQEGLGAQLQESRERRVVGQLRGFLERARRGIQELLVSDVVRDRRELLSVANDDRTLVVDRLPLFRMGLDVRLDRVARESLRVEPDSGRHRLLADEGAVLVEEVPAASVDPEVAPEGLVAGIGGAGERLVEGQSLRVALPPEDVLDLPAGLDELLDELALARRELLHREGHGNLFPSRQARGKIRRNLRARRRGSRIGVLPM